MLRKLICFLSCISFVHSLRHAIEERDENVGRICHYIDETGRVRCKEEDGRPSRARRGLMSVQEQKPNLLVITTDQQRFDTLHFIQNEMKLYEGRVKVSTPNLDRLAMSGVYFRHAYCQSPSCSPARATLRSGCTVRRHGIERNKLSNKKYYDLVGLVKSKILDTETYDQVLVERKNYTAESYGKFHLPEDWYYGHFDKKQRVITYDDYAFENNTWLVSAAEKIENKYRKNIEFFTAKDKVIIPFRNGLQEDPYTGFPYLPISIDSRFEMPTQTSLKNNPKATQKGETKESTVLGIGFLQSNLTLTGLLGQTVQLAIERLVLGDKPFALTASFVAPHPPVIPAPEFAYKYWNARDNIAVSPSVEGLKNQDGSGVYNVEQKFSIEQVQEWTALSYAMVEEVDLYVGKILDTLEQTGVINNTMIIFTSDHGEMLGSHGRKGKASLWDEAIRVPLIMSFPGRIKPGTTVDNPVSHIDVFATILDYLNASEYDRSDGDSLRRFIENADYNRRENTVISERYITKTVKKSRGDFKETILKGQYKVEPQLMIRQGDFKLLIAKEANSKSVDALYNVKQDPFEIKNLLDRQKVSRAIAGKAEHLKLLLLDWMKQKNGKKSFYSDPKYERGEKGGIEELRKRRTWSRVDYWQSGNRLRWGTPVLVESGFYIRYEYVYIGRTLPGTLKIWKIKVQGADRQYFKVIGWKKGKIKSGGHRRIKIAYSSFSPVDISTLKAHLAIVTSDKTMKVKFN